MKKRKELNGKILTFPLHDFFLSLPLCRKKNSLFSTKRSLLFISTCAIYELRKESKFCASHVSLLFLYKMILNGKNLV